MRFDDLLKLQTDGLRSQAVGRRALAPRSRTDPMLEVAQEAEVCFEDQVENVRQRLQREEGHSLDAITDVYEACSQEVLHSKEDSLSALEAKHADGESRQAAFQKDQLKQLENTASTSSDALFAQLHEVNQLDSIYSGILNEQRHRPGSIPVLFRILSRKNEKYGANDWSTTLPNTPDAFYSLLMGTADDSYQSDHVPCMQAFAQGEDGAFSFTQCQTNLYDNSHASGTTPCAAVAAVTFQNQTDATQTCPIGFALSSRNFAGLYLKLDDWEPLFQSTSSATTASETAVLTIPPHRNAVLMAVATPYYYRYSYKTYDRDTKETTTHYSAFVEQFIQLGLFHLKEVAACLSH